MTRATAGIFPLRLWNVVEAIAITLSCIFIGAFLVFYPVTAAKILSKISFRSAEVLSESTFELLRDVTLVWAMGITFVLFDSLSRNSQGVPLLRMLFFDRLGASSSHDCLLLRATLCVSFLLAPALIVVNLGHHSLGTMWLITEDGPLEYATAVNFLMAATLLSYGVYRKFVKFRSKDHRTAAVLITLSGMMFFVGFEEISWGQRIVGFRTPESLMSINTQHEFNIHNIATEELLESYIYISVACFAVSCFSCWNMLAKYHSSKTRWFVVYLPDPSLMPIFAIMVIFSAHTQQNDLVEQLASLVVLLYSIGLLMRAPVHTLPRSSAHPGNVR